MALTTFFKSRVHFGKSILAICILGLALPASAKILLYATDGSQWIDSPHYLPRIHRNSVSGAMMSASTSPQVSHNLRRAHAWSNDSAQNGEAAEELVLTRAIIVHSRPTSLQANMARARAYSASDR